MSNIPDPSPVLQFKFRFLSKNGQPAGFLSSKGSFDGEFLTLGTARFPAQAIAKVHERFGKLAIAVAQQDGSFAPVAFQVYGGKTRQLLTAINTIASVYQSQAHLAHLQTLGKANTFRTIQCPFCNCLVDVSGFPETPQFYCAFCDTIASRDGSLPDANRYRRCDKCQRYSQPLQFTAFYFYFLFVVYGYNYSQKCMCRACMRGEAWTMFFGNLLFVLGVPNAFFQLFRAYSGNLAASPQFKDLDAANALSIAKRTERACKLYEQIEARPGASAGVFYNHAITVGDSYERQAAAQILETALATCSNYPPAAEKLLDLYQRLNRASDIAKLKALWSDEEGNPPPNDAISAPEAEPPA